MEQQSVLIVGAGALGQVVGYHLNLAGVTVSFYVRPAKLETMRPPQRLYCYDDHQLKEFSNYQLVSSSAELAGKRFDFVLVTLDGATCRSSEGVALLKGLGDAIRSSTAMLIIGGVGIGLRDHIRQTTGLPEERLMEGTLGSLSYQCDRVSLPLYAPTDASKLAQATMAYHHFPNKVGFMLSSSPAAAAQQFKTMYDRCGISKVSLMKPGLYRILNNAFFPMTAVCDLAGWPDAKTMVANKPLMSLCVRSMKEIIGLPLHGFTGKIVRLILSEKLLAKTLIKLEGDSLPLDFHAFNKFHHGGKVRDQDIQVMQNCAAYGEAHGQSMPALRELLAKYEAHCKQQSA